MLVFDKLYQQLVETRRKVYEHIAKTGANKLKVLRRKMKVSKTSGSRRQGLTQEYYWTGILVCSFSIFRISTVIAGHQKRKRSKSYMLLHISHLVSSFRNLLLSCYFRVSLLHAVSQRCDHCHHLFSPYLCLLFVWSSNLISYSFPDPILACNSHSTALIILSFTSSALLLYSDLFHLVFDAHNFLDIHNSLHYPSQQVTLFL